MANKPLQSITFPGLPDTYTVPQVDATLTASGAAADAKIVGERLDEIGSGAITDDLKQALLQLASKVAYIDDAGQDYYDDLFNALYPPIPATAVTLSANSLSFGALGSTQTLIATVSPPDTTDEVVWTSSDNSIATVSDGVVASVAYGSCVITATAGSVSATCSVLVQELSVSSISAVYTQSGTVYTTDSLDSLKSDIVVTATYSDSSTAILTNDDYTLSGTLTSGTSTVTVSYGGATTTITVTVVTPLDVEWEYTDGSLTDNGFTETTTGTTSSNMTDSGLVLTASTSSSYIDYSYPVASSYSSMVMEVTCKQTASQGCVYVNLSEGTENLLIRNQYSSGYQGLYLMDGDTIGESTKLVSAGLNSTYTFKLVIDNGYGSVYRNGTLLQSNIDLSTMAWGVGNPFIRFQGTTNYQTSFLLTSVKIKSGTTI